MRAWRAQGSEWVCPSCLLLRRSQRVQDGNGGHPVLLVNFQSDSMDSGLFHSVLSTHITLWELHTQRECGGQPYQRCHHRGMGDPPENGGIGDSQGKNGGTQGRMEGIQGPQGENGRSREPPWAAWGAAMLALSWEQGDPQSRMEGVGRQPPPPGGSWRAAMPALSWGGTGRQRGTSVAPQTTTARVAGAAPTRGSPGLWFGDILLGSRNRPSPAPAS